MAINLVHRPDLDDRVENLAARLGLKGRGRKTAIIERALSALEEQQRVAHPDPTAIAASLQRYIDKGACLRAQLAENNSPDQGQPLSALLQQAVYDEQGPPK